MILFENEFKTFRRNGRLDFNSSCLILCEYRFQDDNLGFNYFIQRNGGMSHAEQLLIAKLEHIEQEYYCGLSEVKLYASYSPCSECAGALAQFISQRDDTTLQVICTALYNHGDAINQQGLRALSNQHGVTLRVIDSRDWKYLSGLREPQHRFRDGDESEIIHRETWDSKWSHQLNAIFNSKPVQGIGSLRSEVESIARERFSEYIDYLTEQVSITNDDDIFRIDFEMPQL